MKALLLHLDGTAQTARTALGAVAGRDLRSLDGKRLLRKGQTVAENHLPVLAELHDLDLSLLIPEPGDVHEDEAAMRLGRAAAGPGVRVEGPKEAKARLVAEHRGLLCVDTAALERMNSVPTVSVYTLFDGRPVEAGELVGEAKVTPLIVAAAGLETAEAAAVPPPVAVWPFVPTQAAALVRERVSPAQARRVAEGLSKKLSEFGSTLAGVHYASPSASPEDLAEAMRGLLADGAGILFVSGGSASDPADPLLNALHHVPARLERVGIPAHPGSMLWLAYAVSAPTPILGVPSCGIFSQSTSLDLVLPPLLAGQPVTTQTFASLGHGGLKSKT
ncbi:MAG: hypothetical protein ACJ78Q_07285 [Chloroflexia bacterium]